MEWVASTSRSVAVTFDVSDTELLQQWVRYQRQADFTEIVRRHLGLVRGIARRQVGAEQADDTAQIVFAILARKASGLGELRSLGSWLHRVTMWQCRAVVRCRIRDRRSHQAAMESALLADARDPLAEALPFLDAAICDLSASDRELIHLRFSDRLTFPEVARRTGRSEAALRQQAGRALEKLGGLLKRRGVVVPVATLSAGLGATLTGTSSASAASSISVVIASSATSGAPHITLLSFFTMTTKHYILATIVIAASVLLLGAGKKSEDRDVGAGAAGTSLLSSRSGSLSGETASAPSKTKVDRSRAAVPRSPEKVKEALEKKAKQLKAVNNARIIGLALFEFENEYGAFPNEETAAAVKQASGTKGNLGAATANDCFHQLAAANILVNSSVLTWEDSPQDGNLGDSGGVRCGFSYVSGMNTAGNPSRPLAVAPLVPGKGTFDPEVFGGKAVILRVDNSVTSLHIERDGTVLVNGMDLFDPAQPFWEGNVPAIRWPAK